MIYMPIIVVVLYSFNANQGRVATKFTGFSLRWYEELFFKSTGYDDALLTSLFVGAFSVLFSTVLGTLGALAYARRKVPKGFISKVKEGSFSFLENVMMLPVMIPEIILGIAFLTLFTFFKIPMGIFSLVLAHTTFCVPYVYIIVKGRISNMDDTLFFAARDLYATPVKAFFTVTLPLIAPAVLSGALIALAMSLDDFVISFFVNGATTTTLPVKIYSSIRFGVSAQINALCTVMLVVVFALVFLSHFVLGRKKHEK